MKNKVELVGESFSNMGKDWIRVLFNLQYNFTLKEDNVKDILNYLNNANIFYHNWELDSIGNDYNALLLRAKDGFENIKFMRIEKIGG